MKLLLLLIFLFSWRIKEYHFTRDFCSVYSCGILQKANIYLNIKEGSVDHIKLRIPRSLLMTSKEKILQDHVGEVLFASVALRKVCEVTALSILSHSVLLRMQKCSFMKYFASANQRILQVDRKKQFTTPQIRCQDKVPRLTL